MSEDNTNDGQEPAAPAVGQDVPVALQHTLDEVQQQVVGLTQVNDAKDTKIAELEKEVQDGREQARLELAADSALELHRLKKIYPSQIPAAEALYASFATDEQRKLFHEFMKGVPETKVDFTDRGTPLQDQPGMMHPEQAENLILQQIDGEWKSMGMDGPQYQQPYLQQAGRAGGIPVFGPNVGPQQSQPAQFVRPEYHGAPQQQAPVYQGVPPTYAAPQPQAPPAYPIQQQYAAAPPQGYAPPQQQYAAPPQQQFQQPMQAPPGFAPVPAGQGPPPGIAGSPGGAPMSVGSGEPGMPEGIRSMDPRGITGTQIGEGE